MKQYYIFIKPTGCRMALFLSVVCLFAFFTGSCTINENDQKEEESDTFPVSFRLPVNDFRIQDNDGVENLRVLICKTSDGAFFFNQKYDASSFANQGQHQFFTIDLELYSGLYNFFIVANCDSYDGLFDQTGLKWQDIQGYPIITAETGVEKPIVTEADLYPFPRAKYFERVRIGQLENPGTNAQISIDNGVTWREDLPADLERLFPKMNIAIRKLTDNEKDRIRVRSLKLADIPAYSYLLQENYGGTEYQFVNLYPAIEQNPAIDWFLTTNNNQGFEDNPDIYRYDNGVGEPQFYMHYGSKDIILPEYLYGSPEYNPVLHIEYDYQSWDIENNNWTPPIENITAEISLKELQENNKYGLLRNNEYSILLTITQIGQFEFKPYIIMNIAGWDEDTQGYYNAGNEDVYVKGQWTNQVPDENNTLYVDMNATIEYRFSFQRENSADRSIIRWKAVLSNPVDFRFSDNKSSEGYARSGEIIDFGVTPVTSSTESKTTKIFINIDNGTGGSIQLPLDQVKEYVVRQNPQ